MRLVAALLTLIALAVAVWAGEALLHEVQTPPPEPVAADVRTPEPQPPGSAAPPRQWPALFGEPQPPAPPPEPEPQPPVVEPQPPAPAMPPLDSLGYRLKGVVSINDVVWAMISHPTGERVLRVGDILQDDLVVTGIEADAVWIGNGQSDPQRLEFVE